MTFNVELSLALPTADDNGICTSQSPTVAGALDIDGALTVSGGAADLVTPQRVFIESDGDESGVTFVVTGTDRYDREQTESLVGPDTTSVYTEKDFLTVTEVTISAAADGNVIVGTGGIGSSAPQVLDQYANPSRKTLATSVSGTVNYTVEVTAKDLSPSWDINNNTPVWFDLAGWDSLSTNQAGTFLGTWTMLRLTVNSGTGTVEASLNTPYGTD